MGDRTGGEITIHPVRPDDWRSHRDLRLEMLLDAPDAFWTQYADVADLDEAGWRRRIENQRHLQARLDGDPVGSVGIWDGPDWRDGSERLDASMLVAMYVAHRARGRHIGERLVEAVLADAVARGKARVVLEVTSSNAPAIALYQRMGFCYNGIRRPHPRNPQLEELEMERWVVDAG
ncbi:MAG: GNAT family N-acetyltransferase [Actinomycetota bacterium]|nr:GNAT family N-acetyltransferase [Actinomycetota bacterium]